MTSQSPLYSLLKKNKERNLVQALRNKTNEVIMRSKVAFHVHALLCLCFRVLRLALARSDNSAPIIQRRLKYFVWVL